MSAKNIFQRGMSWHTYLNLERDFIDITRYVALERINAQTWSEKIAQQLLLTGSVVDSVFYEMRNSSFLSSSKALTDLLADPEPNIGKYRDAYEPIYKLSGIELIAHYGLTNYTTAQKIKPFNPFAPKNNPPWWDAYNDVKHGFFQEMRKGTLDNLVHALGALFTLNALHPDSREYLYRRGVIVTGDMDEGIFSEINPMNIKVLELSPMGVPQNATDFWANSQIFQHEFRKDPNARIDYNALYS